MIDFKRVLVVATIARWLALGAGAIVLVLGLLFWSGIALDLIYLHAVLAILVVLSLFALAVIGAVTGAPTMRWVMALVWTLLVPALGVGQLTLFGYFTGPIGVNFVRSLHLLFGLAAIGTAYGLSGDILSRCEAQLSAGDGAVAVQSESRT